MFLYGEDELGAGAFVGGWVVEERISVGTMATVYRVHHSSRGERGALKVLLRRHLFDPVALGRFELEGRALERVAHPVVVRCLDGGTLPDGLPYWVLEWLEGQTLAARIAQRGPLPLAEASEVMERLFQGVGATHEAGLVHRDLKAENVFCLHGGGIRLLDFGIARLRTEPAGGGLTSTGNVVGTPVALAPEQIRGGAPTPATDVYALGVLAHEVLGGRPPFEAERLIDLEALHLSAPRPSLAARAAIPAALDAVVTRCLDRDPALRYPSIPALAAAWAGAVRGDQAPRAVGVAIRVTGAPGATDERLLTLQDDLEARAVEALGAGGLWVVSETALLLGVRLVEGEPSAALAFWRTFAGQLGQALAPGTDAVRVAISVWVSGVELEAGRITAGDVLHPLRWPGEAKLP